MSTYTDIELEISDPVALIRLNRPEKLNALTYHTLAEIRDAIETAKDDPAVVGIIITGNGRGFCSGLDSQTLTEVTADGGKSRRDSEDPNSLKGMFSYLLEVPKPIIAAVNGACAGLGFVFALMADLRFVDRNAKFTTAFSQRGLIAEHGASWVLPRLIGSGRALDLLWSARKFDGEEAARLGLAERLCEPGQALEAAVDYLTELAANVSPTSLKVIKAQVYRHMNMSLGESMQETNAWMDASLKRDDFREGVRSFIERRPPKFKRVKAD